MGNKKISKGAKRLYQKDVKAQEAKLVDINELYELDQVDRFVLRVKLDWPNLGVFETSELLRISQEEVQASLDKPAFQLAYQKAIRHFEEDLKDAVKIALREMTKVVQQGDFDQKIAATRVLLQAAKPAGKVNVAVGVALDARLPTEKTYRTRMLNDGRVFTDEIDCSKDHDIAIGSVSNAKN